MLFLYDSLFVLFKIEGQHNHLGLCSTYTASIGLQTTVSQFVDVVLVEYITQTETELQLGNELEEGKIEVATHTYLYHRQP